MKQIQLNGIVNALVGFFFLSILVFQKGYNYAPFFLCTFALGYVIFELRKKTIFSFSYEEKLLVWGYFFYFVTFLLIFLINNEKASLLDNPSKVLLFLLLIPLFSRFYLQLTWIFHFIAVGALISGIVAIYHRFILNKPQAFFAQMHIQSGGIAMSIAMFSLIVTFYFFTKKRYKLTALYFVFSLMGILASFLSTARGAWIGLPVILLFILIVYRQYISKKVLGGFLAVMVLAVTTATLVPNTQIAHRFIEAKNEISAYFDKNNGSTSVGARFDMWKSAWLQIQEKPILGWGYKGAVENRKEQGEQKLISSYASGFAHVHNQYLDDFSKRGIVGLFALLGVLCIPFAIFFKRLNKGSIEQTTVAMLGCVHIISVAFYCLSQGFFAHNSGNVFYFFLVIVFYAMLKTTEKASNLCSKY
ncbi:O-antigen ligase family protein [Conservatibacter flavescens]|uniref:O-antigen ligase family protein n=1 Tax=Conservatibacter flavescens TaxID=28161 RepID=UPI001FAE8556|nr:O-antigen ligase [Conservatibacter flavescens]